MKVTLIGASLLFSFSWNLKLFLPAEPNFAENVPVASPGYSRLHMENDASAIETAAQDAVLREQVSILKYKRRRE